MPNLDRSFAGLSNYQIKLLAALLMLVDHVGHVFFQEIPWFYWIGRLSFPLFAWLAVQGEAHTRHFQRYGLRLLALGLISQPVYMWTFGASDWNVLLTLLTGVLCMRGARLWPGFAGLVWVLGAIAANLANFNYLGYGVLLMAMIFYFRSTPLWWAAWILFHTLPMFLLPDPAQALAGFAALIFAAANHQRGPRGLWFYVFYPAHLVALGLLKLGLDLATAAPPVIP